MAYLKAKISDDVKFTSACNHYKDTYEIHAKTLLQRDNTFLVTLLVTVTFALQIPYADLIQTAIVSLIATSPAKIGVPIGGNFVTSMLWAILFGAVIRYFQLAIQVERQYDYLHRIESDLKKHFPANNFFTREGSSYLENYPVYSNWIWLLYTTIFPLSLLVIISLQIYSEVQLAEALKHIATDIVLSTLICITTILYFARIHFGKCST